jgi:hypothetical protein
MQGPTLDRRTFLREGALAAAPLALAIDRPAGPAAHTLTVIAGGPRDRGRAYGRSFRDAIRSFLDREIYRAFIGKPSPREAMLRYAGACARAVRAFSAELHEEMEGVAEGSGLRLEEVVLLNLHEELGRKKVLPAVGHCTAVAVGPPDTAGHTFVGQTWDWMPSVAGLSNMLLWQRSAGPSVLAYAFPGLWVGAGLNSAGLALCWTSAMGGSASGPRVGVPSYALLTHLLYQPTLEAVAAEARRAKHAGWFTFVMADGKGDLLNVEGSPEAVAVEKHRGRLARVGFGSAAMTRTPKGARIKLHPRAHKMLDLLAAERGRNGRETFQRHFGDPKCAICVGKNTLDLMVFDTTERVAFVSRGPAYGLTWKRFTFADRA